MSQLKPSFSASKHQSSRSRNETDSEDEGSRDEEEFIYRGGTPRASKPGSPSQENRDYFSRRDDLYGDTEDSEGYYSSQHYNYQQPSFKQKTFRKQPKKQNMNYASVPIGYDQNHQNPNSNMYYSNRRNQHKFSSDETSNKFKHRISHQPALSHQPINGYAAFPNNQFLNDWDSDEEQFPLMGNMRRRHGYNRYHDRKGILADLSISLLLFIILFGTLSLAFISVSTVPLTDLQVVGITSVVASEKDLSFSLHIRATNWNIFQVKISDPILYIHATPIKPKDPPKEPPKEPLPTTTTTTTKEKPTKTEEPEPTTTDDPEPTKTDDPEPTKTEEPEPTTTDDPEPTKTDDPEPTTTDDPKPTKTEEPEPTKTDKPKPTTTKSSTKPSLPNPTTTEKAPPTKTDDGNNPPALPTENPGMSSDLVNLSAADSQKLDFNQIFHVNIDGGKKI
jgi:hypothetical protein